MANTIIELRHSTVTGNTPSNLANGEIAINTFDGKIFYRGGSSNTVQSIQNFPGPAGLDGEIQFNDSGDLGTSANLSFDRATNTFSTSRAVFTNDITTAGINVASAISSNAIFTQAAFDKANTAETFAQSAFDQSNSAIILAQSASDAANNAATIGDILAISIALG